MSEFRAAQRYAKAILDMAKEHKALDAVEADMRAISSTLSDSKELRDVLASPVVPGASKKSVLTELFKGNHAITRGSIDMLVDNKRIGMLNEVAFKYIILNEKLKGTDVAYVTTAVPLDAATEQKVLKQVAGITGTKVSIENIIDAGIIGGFILRVGDLQYDASIAHKLSNLTREFSSNL